MANRSRRISAHEAALVRWMLTYASVAEPRRSLLAAVSEMRVVDRCRCGCASVDFARAGHGLRPGVIAESTGCTASGAAVDVFLWGHPASVTTLEIVGRLGTVSALPTVDSLVVCRSEWVRERM